MLTIAPISSSEYYLGQTKDALDEYYTRGESPGRWCGNGSKALGLESRVESEDLQAVLAGQGPADGQSLLPAPAQARRSRLGFDLTFSAPKGVSIIGLLGEREVQDAVLQAHADAVDQALEYLEREALFVRRGHAGAERLPAKGLVSASFVHTSSRAGDPQLHSHVLVANLAEGPDGDWSAPDSRSLYRHSRTAGFVYQAALRDELTRSLGVEWSPVSRGMAEPAGVPGQVLKHFSRRRGEIEAALEEMGATSARAANIAAHATRAPKDHDVDARVLVASWRLRASELGFGREALVALAPGGREPGPLEVVGAAKQLLGPDGLTRNRSTFTRQDVLRALAEAARDGASLAALERSATLVLADQRAVELAGDGPEKRWTTAELLATERRLLQSALAARSSDRAMVPREEVERTLAARPLLAGEQAEAVRRLVGDGDGLAVLVGPAGTGKTFVLDTARAAWEAHGLHVLGAALAARTAAALGEAAGVPSSTVAQLLRDLEQGPAGLRPGSVVMVDEAGMVGTRDLAKLWDACQASASKLVLVGDWAQVPEVEAGGSFRALAKALDAPELVQNRRQSEAWEREALAELRTGHPAKAVEAYMGHGRVISAASAYDARRDMVADWSGARRQGDDAVMFALTRADVEGLNRLARELAREAGQVDGPELEAAGRCFGPGDEVVALRNDRRLGLTNGTRGTVASVDERTRSLVLRTEKGKELQVPAPYLDAGHLGWGYALTLHKGQGSTVDRAFVLGGEGLYREAGYTGLSRGRKSNDLYLVTGPSLERESHLPVPKAEVTDVLTSALKRSRAQDLASSADTVSARSDRDKDQLPLTHPERPGEQGPGPLQRWRHLAEAERARQAERSRDERARGRCIGDDIGR